MKRHLAFLLSFLLSAGSALAQSGETINQLSPGAALSGAEQIPIYQGSNPAVTTTPSAVAAYAVGSPRSGLNGWVNIRDPAFGATGNGATDDTAAIQAAIDYAFAHNLSAVYCPAGTYKTSSTLYLDPPGNLRSNLSSPSNFAFSTSFFGDPAASGNYQGCQIRPNFNNGIAFLIGPGQGMRVSDIAVIGPGGGYRGAQSSAGVGIGLSGGNGGSSINLVENTYVANFYALYKTDANNACCLNDSNTYRKVAGDNGYYGIVFSGSQTDINDVVEPTISSTTIAIESLQGRQVNVYGGNLSATSGVSNTFTMGSVSSFSEVTDGSGHDYTFTAVLSGGSPAVGSDPYIANVYNAFTLVTAHYGILPLLITNWNAETDTATFEIRPQWSFANYGTADLTTATDLPTEVAAVTTVYATERVIVADGNSISMNGIHMEDPSGCSALFNFRSSGGSQTTPAIIKNPYFNFDPTQNGNSNNIYYCQQTFPFIATAGLPLTLEGGAYVGSSSADRVLIENQSYNIPMYGNGLEAALNLSMSDNSGGSYGQLYTANNLLYGWAFNTVGHGFGVWDRDYFGPTGLSYPATLSGLFASQGELISPYCGYEPCPSATPNLSPATFALVCPSATGGGSYGEAYTCGSLGVLGSNPPIACRTVFKSVDWNTTGITAGIFKRSASCPGYSWGQSFTNATVGGTVTWSYKGGSDILYLDSATISWMFPGLGVTLTLPGVNRGNPTSYEVTGVWPGLGYISVINASSVNGAPLAGTVGTVYSCSSSCTIGQATFSWTAY